MVSGSEEFHASLPDAGCNPADEPGGSATGLRIYPGFKHEIFNELDKKQVFADLYDWLVAHSGPNQNASERDPRVHREGTAAGQ
jgi:alpha-beta hydrolase superfamily lysophospholipase